MIQTAGCVSVYSVLRTLPPCHSLSVPVFGLIWQYRHLEDNVSNYKLFCNCSLEVWCIHRHNFELFHEKPPGHLQHTSLSSMVALGYAFTHIIFKNIGHTSCSCKQYLGNHGQQQTAWCKCMQDYLKVVAVSLILVLSRKNVYAVNCCNISMW